MKWIRTRVNDKLYSRIVEFARENGLSLYRAARKLLEKGLDAEERLYELLIRDEYLLALIKLKVGYDPYFLKRIEEIIIEEKDELL